MRVEISNGDILDKMSILEIKLNKFDDGPKRDNVLTELKMLMDSSLEDSLYKWLTSNEYTELLEVNSALWLIEDKIRMKEAAQEFDKEFIELARSVYLVNDDRARLKREINMQSSSLLVEEKQYADYGKVNDATVD